MPLFPSKHLSLSTSWPLTPRAIRRSAIVVALFASSASPVVAQTPVSIDRPHRLPASRVNLDDLTREATVVQQNPIQLGAPAVVGFQQARNEMAFPKRTPALKPVRVPLTDRTAASEEQKEQSPTWQVFISNPPIPTPTPAPITIVNVPPKNEAESDTDAKVAEAEIRRAKIADVVSRGIIAQGRAQFNEDAVHAQATSPLSESVTITQMLRQASELQFESERALRRGAYFSARESAVGGLRALAVATDGQQRTSTASEALQAALDAVREAEDFVGRYGQADSAAVNRMIASHQTPVLKDRQQQDMSPHAAADVYLDFARQKFTQAMSQRAEASTLLRVLAQAEKAMRESDIEFANSISLCYLRAAVATNSQDPDALNELGYGAMQLGLLEESEWALELSLASRPTVPAMQNLIEVNRLAGNSERAKQLVAMLPNGGQPQGKTLTVTPIDATSFATISPPVQNATMVTPAGNVGTPQSVAPANSGPQQYAVPPTKPGNVMDRVAGAVKSFWN
jgi:hypothetical protein